MNYVTVTLIVVMCVIEWTKRTHSEKLRKPRLWTLDSLMGL